MGTSEPGYNISEKYKFVWVAPSRTGSRTVSEILTYYDFKFNGFPVFLYNGYRYTHISPNVEQFSDYKIICSARNPYSRVYSHFKNYGHHQPEKTKENFRNYVFGNEWVENNLLEPILKKRPDYIIRIEHIKEDLMKIPFIFDKLTHRQLDLLLLHDVVDETWRTYYDDEMKEKVYQSFRNHFDYWGYEK